MSCNSNQFLMKLIERHMCKYLFPIKIKNLIIMKKKILLSVFVLVSIISTFGQAPEKMNYQGVLRNSSGELIKSTTISIRISLLEGSASGTEVYSETHTVSTSSYGQFSIQIGTGTLEYGDFTTINWASGTIYLKTELDETGNGSYTEFSAVQLVTVPYALYANEVANKDDADADPGNEIQDLDLTNNILTITNNSSATSINLASYQGTNTDEQELNLSGTDLSITGGNTIDLSPIQDGVDDADNDATNEIQDISLTGTNLSITSGSTVNLSVLQDGVDDADNNPINELQNLTFDGDTLKISNGNQVVFPYDSSQWTVNGTNIYYNTGNVGIGTSNPASNLEVKSNVVSSNALFQVINSNNDTVFAVYPDGVKVFVNSDVKGKVGGFAVSGRSPSKSGEVEYMRVTGDSTRIYVNEYEGVKGKVGGFAVSGRSPSKGIVKDYLIVTNDSTRIYINESVGVKGKVGGFAVSGRSPSKGTEKDYFNISGSSTAEIIDPSEARVMWYPNKEAFLVGKVLVESPDSIGTNSFATGFESKAIGDYSQAMGFKSISRGDYSIAIGYNSVAGTDTSEGAFAFGYEAQALGKNSFVVGDSAVATGVNSVAIGSSFRNFTYDYTDGTFTVNAPGPAATANNALAIGPGPKAMGGGSMAFGAFSESSAPFASSFGLYNYATSYAAMAIGGESNSANEERSVVIGGYFNQVNSEGAVIVGGEVNETSSDAEFSAIIGGSWSYTEGYSSVVLGGMYNSTTGLYSAVLGGRYLDANNHSEIVLGQYNVVSTGSSTSWNSSDNILVVGNGANFNNRSNALTLQKNGNLSIAGSIKIGNDSDTASADKVGTFRYREDTNNSYLEVCMKTGASAYTWVTVKTNTW